MDLTILIIAIVVPVCVIGCVTSGLIYFYKYFVLDRRKPPVRITPVNYMPPPVIFIEEIIETWRPLNKREKRRVRYRHLMADLEQQEFERQRAGWPFYGIEEGDEGEEEDETQEIIQPKTLFRRIRHFFFPSKAKTIKKKRRQQQLGSPKRLGKETIEESTRSKRFVSQDRLMRAEARKSLIPVEKRKDYKKEETMVVEDKEGVVAIIDLETMKEERVQAVIQKRQEKRKERKKEGLNGEDRVTVNAGPPPTVVPNGYRKVGFLPNTNPENMLMKRVMYLWDMPPRASGWYCGIIISVSRLPGNNYAIKYDRYETDNIFVDGVHHYDLSFVGEHAYGRKWVLLDPMEGIKVHAPIAPLVPPSPTPSRTPSRPTSATSSRKETESSSKVTESSPPSPVVPFQQNTFLPQTEEHGIVMDIV